MKVAAAILLAVSAAFGSGPAHAGDYSDPLSTCLVTSTTEADKRLLVTFMFAAISRNKDVAAYVDMPPEVRTQINKDTAALYLRLLTVSCLSQTQSAFKSEGGTSINAAFIALSHLATKATLSDLDTSTGMNEYNMYFDVKELAPIWNNE